MNIEKLQFQKDVEVLTQFRGRGTEMISLYVPPSKRIHDVTAYLRDELGQSSNIKSKPTRKNVTSAIESALVRLKSYKQVPDNGLALFIGGDGVEHRHTLTPPEPVPSFLYRCDSHFHTEMLVDMLVEKDVLGLIVVDRKEATVGTVQGQVTTIIEHMNSGVMSKHGKGGQSARRFERLIEEDVHNFFKRVGERATVSFLELPLTGILIGGPGATKEEFAAGRFLHHELQKKVLDMVNCGNTDESGLRELIGAAGEAIQDLSISREKALVDRFLVEITQPAAKATYGAAKVRQALQIGAVDTLLLSHSLDSEAITALSHAADEFGTTVELISVESEEGGILAGTFGGMGALLRY